MAQIEIFERSWPALPFIGWQDTCATLHMWTQVVGKIRLALEPMMNHWWQVPLYVTATGLTTSPMPYGSRSVQIDFDFCHHALVITTSDPQRVEIGLAPMPVAEFYEKVMAVLHDLGIEVSIWTMPVEVADAVPFEQDRQHKSYDADAAQRFWRALVHTDRVMKQFRAGFTGKVSPVHFFWGSFDMAVTRFSGRTAPPHPGGMPNLGNWVAREAYSHEVSSCGFWPGNGGFGKAAFYSYAYPAPPGFADAPLRPAAAVFDKNLQEFILDYDTVRMSDDPDAMLLDFFQSTYDAAANAGRWDRAALERA
ncbi:hypothetical protein YH63_003675 [Afipia massiliensis]|uniref:Ava_C0101 and related proteins n=1 Tax=Afipia massiliensis TaxID=211460 RepID=A0A4U6BL88_9BRAD|nr:DUF5996 family protein [Afipia massiliensis]TKT70581.1 hypothetical protein YH63_003675 [Afipia massiliensis]